MTSHTIESIEQQAKEYAAAADLLAERLNTLQSEIEALTRRHLAAIRRAVRAAADQKAALHTAIEASPGLFDSPRTRVFHGIKIGYQKGKGRLEWSDAERVCQLIRRLFPDDAETLIRTTHEPDRNALQKRTVQDLRRLGVRVVDDQDSVVLKRVDGDVDKLVKALVDLRQIAIDQEAAA